MLEINSVQQLISDIAEFLSDNNNELDIKFINNLDINYDDPISIPEDIISILRIVISALDKQFNKAWTQQDLENNIRTKLTNEFRSNEEDALKSLNTLCNVLFVKDQVSNKLRLNKAALFRDNKKKDESHNASSSKQEDKHAISGSNSSFNTSEALFDKLKSIITYQEDEKISDVWAASDGINVTLEEVLGNDVHLIHPDTSSVHSPASSDKRNSLEGAISYAKIINGFVQNDGGELKKPIVMIINTDPAKAKSEVDASAEGGEHWQTCVILPKQYKPKFAAALGNEHEIIYYLDSLYPNIKIPAKLELLLKEGLKYSFEAEGTIYTHEIPPSFPNAKIIDKRTTNQQLGGSDCGWWALYNALMIVYTAKIEYLNQFKQPSREAAYKLRNLFPKLENQMQLPSTPEKNNKDSNEAISQAELLAIQYAIEESLTKIKNLEECTSIYEPNKDAVFLKIKELSVLIENADKYTQSYKSKLQSNNNNEQKEFIDKVIQFLFEISWRSNELPWSVKDHDKYKLLIPWKLLDFLSNILSKQDDKANHDFVQQLVESTELKKLSELIGQVLEFYGNFLTFKADFLQLQNSIERQDDSFKDHLDKLKSNKYYEKIKECKKNNFQFVSSFITPHIDNFYFCHTEECLQKFFSESPLDYSQEKNRISLLRIFEIAGEYINNLSSALQNKYNFVPWKDIRDIRHAIEHLNQKDKINENIKEILNDSSGKIAETLHKELQIFSKALYSISQNIKSNQPIDDNIKNLSYHFIKFINSSSVLSIEEHSVLAEDLKKCENQNNNSISLNQSENLIDKLTQYIFNTRKKENKFIQQSLQEIARTYYKEKTTFLYLILIANNNEFKAFLKNMKNAYKDKLSEDAIKDEIEKFVKAIDLSKLKLPKITAEYFIQIINRKEKYPGEEIFSDAIESFTSDTNLKLNLITYHTKITANQIKSQKQDLEIFEIIDKLVSSMYAVNYEDTINSHKFNNLLNILEKKLKFNIEKSIWSNSNKANRNRIKETLTLLDEEVLGIGYSLELQELMQEEEKLQRILNNKSKITAEVNKINAILDKLIESTKLFQASPTNLYTHQLFIEFQLERVGDIAIDLLDHIEFQTNNNPDYIRPRNLLFLNNLRKILAHRKFELSEELLNLTVNNINIFMKLDLQQVISNIHTNKPSQLIIKHIDNKKLIDPKIIFNKQNEIQNLKSKYGIKELYIIGKLTESNIGILSDFDLMIDHDPTSGLFEQLRFEWELEELLKCSVKTWTVEQFEKTFILYLTLDYINKLKSTKIKFEDFLSKIDTQNKIEAHNLFYFKRSTNVKKDDFNQTFDENEINEFWEDLIKASYITQEGELTDHFLKLKDSSEMIMESYSTEGLKLVYDLINKARLNNSKYKSIKSSEQADEKKPLLTHADDRFWARKNEKIIKRRKLSLEREKNLPPEEQLFHRILKLLSEEYADSYIKNLEQINTLIGIEEISKLVINMQELRKVDKKLDCIAEGFFQRYYKQILGLGHGTWNLKDYRLIDEVFIAEFQHKLEGIKHIRDQISENLSKVPENKQIEFIELLYEENEKYLQLIELGKKKLPQTTFDFNENKIEIQKALKKSRDKLCSYKEDLDSEDIAEIKNLGGGEKRYILYTYDQYFEELKNVFIKINEILFPIIKMNSELVNKYNQFITQLNEQNRIFELEKLKLFFVLKKDSPKNSKYKKLESLISQYNTILDKLVDQKEVLDRTLYNGLMVREEVEHYFIYSYINSIEVNSKGNKNACKDKLVIIELIKSLQDLENKQQKILINHLNTDKIDNLSTILGRFISNQNKDQILEFIKYFNNYSSLEKLNKIEFAQIYNKVNDLDHTKIILNNIDIIASFDQAKSIYDNLFNNKEVSIELIYEEFLKRAVWPPEEPVPNWCIDKFSNLPDIYNAAYNKIEEIFIDKVKAKIDNKDYIPTIIKSRYLYESNPFNVDNKGKTIFDDILNYLLPLQKNFFITKHNCNIWKRGDIINEYIKIIENHLEKHSILPLKEELKPLLFKSNITFIKRIKGIEKESTIDLDALYNDLAELENITIQTKRADLYYSIIELLNQSLKPEIAFEESDHALSISMDIKSKSQVLKKNIKDKINRFFELKKEKADFENYFQKHQADSNHYQATELRKKIQNKENEILTLNKEIQELLYDDKNQLTLYFKEKIYSNPYYFLLLVEKLDFIKDQLQQNRKIFIESFYKEFENFKLLLSEKQELQKYYTQWQNDNIVSEKFKKFIYECEEKRFFEHIIDQMREKILGNFNIDFTKRESSIIKDYISK